MDFGAKADGFTLDSPAVQKAVDSCSENGGGTVFFPKGIYVLATFFLKSNVHINFEDGTDILGSLDFYDYAQQEEIDYSLYQDASHSYFAGCNDVDIHDVKMRVYIDGLLLDNVTVESYRPDAREDFVFEKVNNLEVR